MMMEHAMHKSLLILFCCLPALASADNRPTTPADLEQIERLQKQSDKLGFSTSGTNQYAVSKARAWLDLALDEYYETDRTGIVQDATGEAAAILDGLARDPAFDASATALPDASEKVRPDLWQQAAAMKQHADFACASPKIAELEVQLVWTGHEKWTSGWSHAEPYARIAENLAYEAQRELDACALKHAPTAPAVIERIVVEQRSLATDVLFTFNRAGVEYLAPGGKQKLDALAAELKTWKTLTHIQLVGHTDRLGSDRTNQQLSQRRSDAIKRYLLSQGITVERIEARGRGESQPIVQCHVQRSPPALIECLQPNRRVDMTIEGLHK